MAEGSSEGKTKVVSERFISLAIACICSVESPEPSGMMASGFPQKRDR